MLASHSRMHFHIHGREENVQDQWSWLKPQRCPLARSGTARELHSTKLPTLIAQMPLGTKKKQCHSPFPHSAGLRYFKARDSVLTMLHHYC